MRRHIYQGGHRYVMDDEETPHIGDSTAVVEAGREADAKLGNQPGYPSGHALADKARFAGGPKPADIDERNSGSRVVSPATTSAFDEMNRRKVENAPPMVNPTAAANTRNQMRAAGVLDTSRPVAEPAVTPFTKAITAPLPKNPGFASLDYPAYQRATEAQRSAALGAPVPVARRVDPQAIADREAGRYGGRYVTTPEEEEEGWREAHDAGPGKLDIDPRYQVPSPIGPTQTGAPLARNDTATIRTPTWQEGLAQQYPAFHQAGSLANQALVNAVKAAKIDPADQSPATRQRVAQIAAGLAKQNPEHHVAGQGGYPMPPTPQPAITSTNFGQPNIAAGPAQPPLKVGPVSVGNTGAPIAASAPIVPSSNPLDFTAPAPMQSPSAPRGQVSVGSVSMTPPANSPPSAQFGNVSSNGSDPRLAMTPGQRSKLNGGNPAYDTTTPPVVAQTRKPTKWLPE